MLTLFDLIVLSAVFALVALFQHVWKTLTYWKTQGVRGPTSWPLVGNSHENLFKPITELEIERMKKYGKIYGYVDCMRLTLTIGDPQLLKLIMVKDFDKFTNRVDSFKLQPPVSTFLGVLKDDDWRRVRMILGCAFTTTKLKLIMDTMSVCIEECENNLRTLAKNRESFDIKEVMGVLALDVFALSAFGTKTKAQTDPHDEFHEKAKKFLNFNSPRAIIAPFLPKVVRNVLNCHVIPSDSVSYFKKLVTKVITERKVGKNVKNDFLQLVLEAEANEEELKTSVDTITEGYNLDADDQSQVFRNQRNVLLKIGKNKKLTHDEVVANCIFFLAAGHEAMATTLTYAIYALATNPDVQEKLHACILDVTGDDDITYEMLNRIQYLDAVINEVMRIYGATVHADRICTTDYKLGDTGIVIPKGAVVNIPIYAIHHNEEYWPEAEKFKPDRFLPENRSRIKPFTFIPFGGGPRFCIGMLFALLETKLVLVRTLRKFNFVATKDTVRNVEFIAKRNILCSHSLLIRVEERIL